MRVVLAAGTVALATAAAAAMLAGAILLTSPGANS